MLELPPLIPPISTNEIRGKKTATHAAGAGNGEACPWESTKDDKIESAADVRIDRLVYELSPDGDDIWVERRGD